MSRLQTPSSPLYVPARTDPTASEAFVEEAASIVGGALSRHTLATLPARFHLEEKAALTWLAAASEAKGGQVWDRVGLAEVEAVIRSYTSHGVTPEYVRVLSSRYDFLKDSLTIEQLHVYSLPAEWAADASIQPWTVYSLHLMHEAGVPADYTTGWDNRYAERVSDLSLMQLYKAGVPHNYALVLASTKNPARAIELYQAGVPVRYAQSISPNRSVPAADIILLHEHGVAADAARRYLEQGLTAAAAVLVVNEGVPVEYALAIS